MLLQNPTISLDVNSVGAWITRLQVGTTHFFYPRELVNVDGALKFRGGCHICSPIFGKAKSGGLQLPDHGGLREKTWKSYQDECGLSGYLERTLEVRRQIDLDYHLTYEVVHQALMVTTIVRNCAKAAEIDLAWHPYFNAPIGAVIRFGQDVMVDKPFEAKIYPWPEKKFIQIELPSIGKVIMVTRGEHRYDSVCIWTDWMGRYVCVEPLRRGKIKNGEVWTSKLLLEFLPV